MEQKCLICLQKKKKNFGIKEFTAKAKRIAPPAKDKELESSPPRHKITPWQFNTKKLDKESKESLTWDKFSRIINSQFSHLNLGSTSLL